MTPGRQMLELVGNLTLERDVSLDEFLAGALAIITAAIGKLPLERQENVLNALEAGELRASVERFVERCAGLQARRYLQ